MAGKSSTLREWIGRVQSSAGPDIRQMQVSNLTRGTVVGTSIDLADKGPRRRRGLLDHTELRDGEGLWIVPCESVHTFFMKFALDLIYLNRMRTVVGIRSHVVPWRMSMCLRAHSILELASGTIVASQTRCGDQLELIQVKAEPASVQTDDIPS